MENQEFKNLDQLDSHEELMRKSSSAGSVDETKPEGIERRPTFIK